MLFFPSVSVTGRIRSLKTSLASQPPSPPAGLRLGGARVGDDSEEVEVEEEEVEGVGVGVEEVEVGVEVEVEEMGVEEVEVGVEEVEVKVEDALLDGAPSHRGPALGILSSRCSLSSVEVT